MWEKIVEVEIGEKLIKKKEYITMLKILGENN